MTTPFFSIIMPTRGRSEMFPIAVASLFSQTFTDYEFLIVDNSLDLSTFNTWYSKVAPHVDARFKYTRTGALTMSDNFEFAFDQAVGRYVLVLTDKMIMNVDFLAKLAAAVAHEPPLMMYHDLLLSNAVGQGLEFDQLCAQLPVPLGPDDLNSGEIIQLDSREVASLMLSGNQPIRGVNASHYSPRTYNTVFRNDFLAKLKAEYGALFDGISPDDRINMLALDALPTVEHISIVGNARYAGGGYSNGNANATSLDNSFSFLDSLPPRCKHNLANSPVGYMPLWWLSWWHDWLGIVQKSRGSLQGLSVSASIFFANLHNDILRMPADDPRVPGMRKIIESAAQSYQPDESIRWTFMD